MPTYLFLCFYILPIVLGIFVAWLIAPDKAMAFFNEMPKVLDRPAEIVMGASIITCVLLAWPWTEDGRIYFRDIQENCYKRRKADDVCRHRENFRYDYVCCSAVCPKLKEEKEKRDAKQF